MTSGKVVPLGQHLRADQDARLAAVDALDRFLERPRLRTASRSMRASGKSGKQLGQRLLDALGALAHGLAPA